MAAGRTFNEEAQKHFRVRFADKKTAIVSSHQKLVLSVARQLGLQKEAVQTQTVGLGVDVSDGKTRTVTSARRKPDCELLTRRAGFTSVACTQRMKSQTFLMWSGGPFCAWLRRRTAR